MSILDLLGSALTGNVSADQSAPSTTVSEPIVTASRRDGPPDPVQMQTPQSGDNYVMSPPSAPGPMQPQGAPQTSNGPAVNYNNSDDVRAAQAANDASPPQGGMANPGLYGLLPANLQHGVLRNLLGKLGDAYSGTTRYEDHMEQQQLGNAMAGMNINDPNSVQAAVARIGVTGAKGAADLSDKIQQQAQTAALKNATLDQNSWYKGAVLDNKADNALARYTPYIGNMAQQATTKEQYQQAYQQAETIAQRIGSKYHAYDFPGMVDPEDWKPGMQFGMTANQSQMSADKALQRGQSDTNNIRNNQTNRDIADVRGGYQIRSARISAGRPSPTTEAEGLQNDQDQGRTLTPAQQARWNKLNAIPRSARVPSTGGGSMPSTGNAGADVGAFGGSLLTSKIPTVTPQQAAKLPKGTHFRTTDGRVLIR